MRRLVVLLGLVLLLAGCRVDGRVVIRLDDNGSGAVAARLILDAEAVEVLEFGGGALEERVRLADLADAGWKVGAWERASDGSASVRVSQAFAGEAELVALLVDLFGDDGLLSGARLERERGFLESSDGLSLDADLSVLSAGVSADEELRTRLEQAGLDPDALDARLGEELDSSFALSVTLVVPRGTERTFRLEPGDEQTLNLSSSKLDAGRLTTTLMAAMLAFLAVLLYVSASVSARRRRRRARLAAGVRVEPPLW